MEGTYLYILIVIVILLGILIYCVFEDLHRKPKDCAHENCAHFLDNESLHFYRKKFIYTIGIGTFIFVLIFISLSFLHDRSQQRILEQHRESCEEIGQMFREQLKASPDDSIYNEAAQMMIAQSSKQIESLLELQFDKLQNDFNFISLWAGLLTIVFLIFSIYSMFKTDEIQKQAKYVLEKSEEAYQQIKETAAHSAEKLEESQSKLDGKIQSLDDLRGKKAEELDGVRKKVEEKVESDFSKLSLELRQMVINVLADVKKDSSKEESVGTESDSPKDALDDIIKQLQDSNRGEGIKILEDIDDKKE